MATIKDIAHILTEKYNLNGKDADFFTTAFVDTIIEGLTADRLVKIKGLGTFKIQAVKERSSVNVNTGERVLINGHDKITFTPDNTLRDLVNKPFAQFDTITLDDGVDIDVLTSVEEDESEDSVQESVSISPESENVTSEPEESTPEPEESSPEPEETTLSTAAVQNEEEPKINPYVAPIINKVEETPAEQAPETIEVATPVTEVEEPETKVAESDTKADEAEDDEIEYEEDDSISSEEYHHCRKMFFIYATIVTVLLAVAAFFAGYYCSEYNLFGCNNDCQSVKCPAVKPQVKPAKVVRKATPKPTTATKDSTSAVAPVKKENKTNATKQAVPAKQVASPAKQVASPAKQVASPAKQVASPAKQVEEKKPSAMTQYNTDARVRTGAYAIVGTKTTHTVKAGQTASSIAKTYLGPGMECYVEAYNGGRTDFKAGEKVKIPELILKKRLKK